MRIANELMNMYRTINHQGNLTQNHSENTPHERIAPFKSRGKNNILEKVRDKKSKAKQQYLRSRITTQYSKLTSQKNAESRVLKSNSFGSLSTPTPLQQHYSLKGEAPHQTIQR